MAHFAKLDENNVVVQIVKIANIDIMDLQYGGDKEETGIRFCKEFYDDNATWVQTSYNSNFRGNYAGIGFTYMEGVATVGVATTSVFIEQKPYPSWSISTTSAVWESPIGDAPTLTDSQVENDQYYTWDEDTYQADNTTGWVLTTRVP
jgi:hypothetical protein